VLSDIIPLRDIREVQRATEITELKLSLGIVVAMMVPELIDDKFKSKVDPPTSAASR